MTSLLTEINKYLFYEFDGDGDESDVSDHFPFELRYAGSVELTGGKTEVFEFVSDDEDFFAVAGRCLNFFPKDGMVFEDLKLQMLGAEWISNRAPIDLDTSRIGDDSVPPTLERPEAIEILCARFSGGRQNAKILEGLYMRRTGKYLALVQNQSSSSATILGDGFAPHEVGFAEASAWRRLSFGVGELLSFGGLE